jgi:lactoylglutathione lyase
MTFKRLGHIAIRVRDIEASAKFYRETLGMKEAFRMYNGEGNKLSSVHMFISPSNYIEIFPNGVKDPRRDHLTEIGLNHICLEVDDIAKCLEEARGRGAPIDVDLKKGFSRCIQFWTHDPDGNRIEFMELPSDSMQIEANKRIAAEEAAAK